MENDAISNDVIFSWRHSMLNGHDFSLGIFIMISIFIIVL